MHTAVCCRNNTYTSFTDCSVAQLRAWLAEPELTLWLDCPAPTLADFERIRQVFPFHALALEDVDHRHNRPKIEIYDQHYFVAFFAAGYNPTDDAVFVQPLYLFVGQNYLVSMHPDPIPQIAQTRTRWVSPNTAHHGKISL